MKQTIKKFGIPFIIILGLGLCAILWFWVKSNINLIGYTSPAAEAVLQLPSGFKANVYVRGLDGPRFAWLGGDGVIYVADRGNNRIVRLPDEDGDGVADEITVFADEIDRPHSLVFYEGVWFVGVPSGVIALRDVDGNGVADERVVLIDDYPTSGHSTRTVTVLPDGRLVVSIGSSCNVCEEEDERRAAVVVYDLVMEGGSVRLENERVWATGLRNAVGLAIEPEMGLLWGSNNGRDLLGDEEPPENIYIIQDGGDYGWPYCHSGNIEDPEYGFSGSCVGVIDPEIEMQAHSAPLGLLFYTGELFPKAYQGDLFVAFHGSWNRSVPTGYKIVHLPVVDGKLTGEINDFATGWMGEDGEIWGRPVGLVVGEDGALYVTDDKAGIVYRIIWDGVE